MAEPRVTFALVCYEHEAFVEEAVASVLAQDGPPLDIVISDDASSDGTWAAIERAVAGYEGPHRVRINRNDRNMGMNHYNRVLELAEGDILVIGHGDDIALPNRARRLVETMISQGVSLVTSDAHVTDIARNRSGSMTGATQSRRLDMDELLTRGWQREMLGATMAYRREVLSRFNGIDRTLVPAGYDLPLVFRAALLDGAFYLAEPLLEWRRHDRNLSEQLTDRSTIRLVEDEGAAGHAVTVLMAMLADLEAFRQQNPDRADLPVIRRRLVLFILHHLRNWTRRRNRLFVEGKRATWLDRDDWLARRSEGSRRITASRRKRR